MNTLVAVSEVYSPLLIKYKTYNNMSFLNNNYERAAAGSQYLKFSPNDKATI